MARTAPNRQARRRAKAVARHKREKADPKAVAIMIAVVAIMALLLGAGIYAF